MAFVKLDCGILNSTLWMDRPSREIFLTALLMAEPRQFDQPTRQLKIQALEETGWEAPAGWYGFVEAGSTGIMHRALLEPEEGIAALERLGEPEPESRSQAHDGRRMIRVDGGFLILNFFHYRDKDHSAAERQRKFRARQKERLKATTVDITSRNPVTSRNITQAEAEAEAYLLLTDPSDQSVSAPCPYEKIRTLFVELVARGNQIIPNPDFTPKWSGGRKQIVRTRWRAMQDLKKWHLFFKRVSDSDLLMGRKKDWHCTFDWLMKAENFQKVWEGNYED